MASRRKTRGREAQIGFEALSIEGALLSPEWLARVAQLGAGHQAEADYRVPKGLHLRDEIGRYWRIAQAHWAELSSGRAAGADAAALAAHVIPALLRDAFGFGSLAPVSPVAIGERAFPIGHAALGGRVPVVIAPAGAGIETLLPALGDGNRRRTAFGLVQEHLNAVEDAVWGVATDGVTLRIVRDNASLTRPAWIEADLGRIFAEDRYADFTALWLLLHESRFGRPDQPSSACILEAWRTAGREEGTRAREHLRRGVQDALEALGQGFLAHPENGALRAALESGSLTRDAYFQELLRLVYRLIFLLTAEERGLLHPEGASDEARRLYAEGYGLRRLRERAVKRSAHDRFSDLWEATKIVLRGVASGEPRLGLPALSGLFAPTQCPTLDASRLENRALLLAVFRLSWLREASGLARVNWRDMGPEELGSVYESLLELVPQIREGRTFTFATGAETKGNARKTTGSYYTPDSLVHVLLDSALEPVVASTIAANPGREVDALLELAIVDPACGSGHFLLAAARRLGGHVARLQAGGTPTSAQYRHAVRQVVSRCIFGVDLNPMAVELCRVSLWMEAIEPGLPLTFLRSHIRHGNSLLGTTPELMAKGIPDEAWSAIEGDDKKVATALKKRNKQAREGGQRGLGLFAPEARSEDDAAVARAVGELEAATDADAGSLAAKESRWESILASDPYRHAKFVADAWCAAFVWPKQAGDLADAAPTNDLWRQIRDRQGEPPELTVTTVEELADQYRFFHWHLAFPQVFARGGFDVVLGNPPWDTLSPDAKEFFSQFDASIREVSPAALDARIADLTASPQLATSWATYRRAVFATMHMLRTSGRFVLYAPGTLGKGDFNVFRMFAELAVSETRTGGYAAQVVPDGFYGGGNAMAIRRSLLESCRLKIVLGFVNTRHVWFPAVHASAKFALYVAQRGGNTNSFCVAFNINSEEALNSAIRDGGLRLSVDDVRRFSPDALAIVDVRAPDDLRISRRMYERWPPLGAKIDGTAYRDFLRELETGHAQHCLTDDARHLPHFEGRMISRYDHRAKGYRSGRARSAVWDDLPFSSTSKSIQPQWYVPRDLVPSQTADRIDLYRVAFCDVASPTNERTLVATVIPPHTVAGANVPTLLMRSSTPLPDLLAWLAVANSFAMDFLARMKVALHVSISILDSLPFPRFQREDPAFGFIVPRVARLLCCSPEMIGLWNIIADEGFVPAHVDDSPIAGIVEPRARSLVEAELDAYVALNLFGLAAQELAYILDTFPIVRRRDEKAHGEYRTKRVILEIYDAMAEAIRTGVPYQTRLDPPPADPRVAHPPDPSRAART